MAEINIHKNGKEWICGVCGGIANAGSDRCLRQVVRHYNTVVRCAKGFRESSLEDSRTLATKNAELQGPDYYSLFILTLKGETQGSSSRASIFPQLVVKEMRIVARAPRPHHGKTINPWKTYTNLLESGMRNILGALFSLAVSLRELGERCLRNNPTLVLGFYRSCGKSCMMMKTWSI